MTCFPACWEDSFPGCWKASTLLPWKELSLPPLLLLSCSRWDQQLWTPAHWADGKAERLSWGFWLTTSNSLGWCQSTALSVLVGSAALTGWTKAQASKGQLLIYAHWTYNLVTTRTNTALEGQPLLWVNTRRVTQSACHLDGFERREGSITPTWHHTANVALSCSISAWNLLHQTTTASQSSPGFRQQSSCTDSQLDGSSKPPWKSCTINREHLDPTFM